MIASKVTRRTAVSSALRVRVSPRAICCASSPSFQVRHYTQYPGLNLPRPPPREYNPDGTPKRYRLNERFYDHGYTWEQWTLVPAGAFHTVYKGKFAQAHPPGIAFCDQFPWYVQFVPRITLLAILAIFVCNLGNFGVRPRRFTKEWLDAQREMERAQNTNPVTRYLDRRRKERGPNWMPGLYLPLHPYFWMGRGFETHDPQLLREKLEKLGAANSEGEEVETEGVE